MFYTLGLYPLRSSGYRAFVGLLPVWSFWSHCINPKTYWRAIKYFCQRGYRGYADCDHWNMYSYTEYIMLGLLKDLKKHKQGFPQSCSDYPMDHIDSDDDPVDTGLAKWQAILSEMIEGLEASIELDAETTVPDGVYDERQPVFVEVPNSNGELFTMEHRDFDSELYESWRKPLLAKRKRATLLLVKYWESLWD